MGSKNGILRNLPFNDRFYEVLRKTIDILFEFSLKKHRQVSDLVIFQIQSDIKNRPVYQIEFGRNVFNRLDFKA